MIAIIFMMPGQYEQVYGELIIKKDCLLFVPHDPHIEKFSEDEFTHVMSDINNENLYCEDEIEGED